MCRKNTATKNKGKKKMKNNNNIIWKFVPKTHKQYKVNNLGELFHKTRAGKWRQICGTPAGKIHNTKYGEQRYTQVLINGKFRYLHRVVLESFVKQPTLPKNVDILHLKTNSKHFCTIQVDHKNNDITDNRLENLHWVSWLTNNLNTHHEDFDVNGNWKGL